MTVREETPAAEALLWAFARRREGVMRRFLLLSVLFLTAVPFPVVALTEVDNPSVVTEVPREFGESERDYVLRTMSLYTSYITDASSRVHYLTDASYLSRPVWWALVVQRAANNLITLSEAERDWPWPGRYEFIVRFVSDHDDGIDVVYADWDFFILEYTGSTRRRYEPVDISKESLDFEISDSPPYTTTWTSQFFVTFREDIDPDVTRLELYGVSNEFGEQVSFIWEFPEPQKELVSVYLGAERSNTAGARLAIRAGMTDRLTLRGTYSDGSEATPSCIWQATGNAGSVTPDGTFTAATVAGARGELRVTAEGNIYTIPVTVVAGPMKEIVLSPDEVSLAVGDRAVFSAAGYDEYGNSVGRILPMWFVVPKELGTISFVTGTFTAKAAGEGYVLAFTQGKLGYSGVGGARARIVVEGDQPASAPTWGMIKKTHSTP